MGLPECGYVCIVVAPGGSQLYSAYATTDTPFSRRGRMDVGCTTRDAVHVAKSEARRHSSRRKVLN